MSDATVKIWTNPEVVRIQWGERIYDYYVDSLKTLNKFLHIKNVAGINKASAWIKDICYKMERVDYEPTWDLDVVDDEIIDDADDYSLENLRSHLSKNGWYETLPTSDERVFEFGKRQACYLVVRVRSGISKNDDQLIPNRNIIVNSVNTKEQLPLSAHRYVDAMDVNWRNILKQIILDEYEFITKLYERGIENDSKK